MQARVTVDRDFFLSFTGADRPWAAWLLAELDAAGYSSLCQLRDFVAGGNIPLDMDRAIRRTRRTLGVLSPQALQAPFVQQEWAQRLASDPTGQQRLLILIRVGDCQPEGLLGPVLYIDMVGLDEVTARRRLREELAATVRGERPVAAINFPGGDSTAGAPGVGQPRFPTALPPVWNVPFRRNPTFTGREQVLAGLADQLGQGPAAAVIQTLQGGGGVGKTALAVEYAYRHRTQFDTVWWVRAEEPTTLINDYADLAAALGLSQAGQADQQLATLAVRRWLDAHDHWLLVLDNADSPETPTGLPVPLARLVDLIPQVPSGQVLVTSRDASWEDHAGLAELEVFTPEEAVAFLLARAASADQAMAAQVSELLGFLPLALEQAGAYVRETRLSLAGYLDRLQRFPALTLARGRPRDRNPADTVATTWQLSLERVRSTPGAVALLEVCAFLDSEAIPRELFAQQMDPPAADLAVLADDPFALDDVVAALRRFGLVKADEQSLMVHRLLQQVVGGRLDPVAKEARVGMAVRLLAQRLPSGGHADPKLWPDCARLLPHALAATEYAVALGVEPLATAELLANAASYLRGRARYADARPLLERGLRIREARLGPDHTATAASLNYLGNVLREQGDPGGARLLHERALAIREARLGPDHPNTAASLNNLGNILARDQGDLAGARPLYERALAIREARLGPDHPDTAWTLSNLASVLHGQGNLAGARSLFERALRVHEARLGPDHPDTARTLNHLANVLTAEGNLAGARPLFERALRIREARLGPDHPDTARSQQSLAALTAELDKGP